MRVIKLYSKDKRRQPIIFVISDLVMNALVPLPQIPLENFLYKICDALTLNGCGYGYDLDYYGRIFYVGRITTDINNSYKVVLGNASPGEAETVQVKVISKEAPPNNDITHKRMEVGDDTSLKKEYLKLEKIILRAQPYENDFEQTALRNFLSGNINFPEAFEQPTTESFSTEYNSIEARKIFDLDNTCKEKLNAALTKRTATLSRLSDCIANQATFLAEQEKLTQHPPRDWEPELIAYAAGELALTRLTIEPLHAYIKKTIKDETQRISQSPDIAGLKKIIAQHFDLEGISDYNEYDLILMYFDRDKIIDIEELHEISRNKNNNPILIYQNNIFSLYGCADEKWKITTLDSKCFIGLPFSIQQADILPKHNIKEEMRQEIIAKNAHTERNIFISTLKQQYRTYKILSKEIQIVKIYFAWAVQEAARLYYMEFVSECKSRYKDKELWEKIEEKRKSFNQKFETSVGIAISTLGQMSFNTESLLLDPSISLEQLVLPMRTLLEICNKSWVGSSTALKTLTERLRQFGTACHKYYETQHETAKALKTQNIDYEEIRYHAIFDFEDRVNFKGLKAIWNTLVEFYSNIGGCVKFVWTKPMLDFEIQIKEKCAAIIKLVAGTAAPEDRLGLPGLCGCVLGHIENKKLPNSRLKQADNYLQEAEGHIKQLKQKNINKRALLTLTTRVNPPYWEAHYKLESIKFLVQSTLAFKLNIMNFVENFRKNFRIVDTNCEFLFNINEAITGLAITASTAQSIAQEIFVQLKHMRNSLLEASTPKADEDLTKLHQLAEQISHQNKLLCSIDHAAQVLHKIMHAPSILNTLMTYTQQLNLLKQEFHTHSQQVDASILHEEEAQLKLQTDIANNIFKKIFDLVNVFVKKLQNKELPSIDPQLEITYDQLSESILPADRIVTSAQAKLAAEKNSRAVNRDLCLLAAEFIGDDNYWGKEKVLAGGKSSGNGAYKIPLGIAKMRERLAQTKEYLVNNTQAELLIQFITQEAVERINARKKSYTLWFFQKEVTFNFYKCFLKSTNQEKLTSLLNWQMSNEGFLGLQRSEAAKAIKDEGFEWFIPTEEATTSPRKR